VRVHVDRAAAEGVEANARKLRYEAYAQSTADVLVLAQHLDDQSETVLLQLLRGGGVRALSGMPTCRSLAGFVASLVVTRQQLERYAAQHQLSWVSDDSNADIHYRRNMLRHCIMPVLAEHVPDYRQHIARTAWHMSQASSLIEEVVAADLERGRKGHGFDVASLLALSEVRQGFVLLAWLRERGVVALSPERAQEFLRQLRGLVWQVSQASWWVMWQCCVTGASCMLFACCVMCVPNDVPVFSGESAEQFFPDWGAFALGAQRRYCA
jgi:tRNA(Ile)-lysidine synthase